jgi:hypothetical protein
MSQVLSNVHYKRKQLDIFKHQSKFNVSVKFLQHKKLELLNDGVYQTNTVKLLRVANHGHLWMNKAKEKGLH